MARNKITKERVSIGATVFRSGRIPEIKQENNHGEAQAIYGPIGLPTEEQRDWLEKRIKEMSRPIDKDTIIGGPKPTSTNPKDKFGSVKVDATKLPAIAVAHGAMAMMDGARKYGPYNWRSNPVIAHIYIAAAKRHLDCWFEGQEEASDSGVHHLGHAIACCAILLDAQATGNLVDDRPPVKDPNLYANMLEELSQKIKKLQEKLTATK